MQTSNTVSNMGQIVGELSPTQRAGQDRAQSSGGGQTAAHENTQKLGNDESGEHHSHRQSQQQLLGF